MCCESRPPPCEEWRVMHHNLLHSVGPGDVSFWVAEAMRTKCLEETMRHTRAEASLQVKLEAIMTSASCTRKTVAKATTENTTTCATTIAFLSLVTSSCRMHLHMHVYCHSLSLTQPHLGHGLTLPLSHSFTPLFTDCFKLFVFYPSHSIH